METHCFLLARHRTLVATDPVSNDLFTVGRCNPGELVGIIDLLRQGPESAIARQPCRLLSLLGLLVDLIKDDQGLLNGLEQLQSPCEGLQFCSCAESTQPTPCK